MKGKITVIKLVRNEQEVPLGYEIIVEFDDKPNLKLGDCEIKQ